MIDDLLVVTQRNLDRLRLKTYITFIFVVAGIYGLLAYETDIKNHVRHATLPEIFQVKRELGDMQLEEATRYSSCRDSCRLRYRSSTCNDTAHLKLIEKIEAKSADLKMREQDRSLLLEERWSAGAGVSIEGVVSSLFNLPVLFGLFYPLLLATILWDITHLQMVILQIRERALEDDKIKQAEFRLLIAKIRMFVPRKLARPAMLAPLVPSVVMGTFSFVVYRNVTAFPLSDHALHDAVYGQTSFWGLRPVTLALVWGGLGSVILGTAAAVMMFYVDLVTDYSKPLKRGARPPNSTDLSFWNRKEFYIVLLITCALWYLLNLLGKR
ncbi:MAG: hypothetical protein IPG71_07030 [bacterium]|nr:hypothetical protein [bacterium]